MKKFKIFLLLGLAFILGIDKINAECDNKTQLEINTASSNVTMNYNINTVVLDRNGKEHPEISPSDVETGELSEYLKSDKITIKIENITDKIYVVFQNLDEKINKEYHYRDLKDGTITYEVPDNKKIRNYKLIIYSDVSDCLNQELRIIDLKTPMYNENSSYAYCINNNSYYCQKYITTEIGNDESIYNDYLESQNNGVQNNATGSEKTSNKLLLNIGIVTVIVLIIVIVFVIYKKNKNKFKQNIGM